LAQKKIKTKQNKIMIREFEVRMMVSDEIFVTFDCVKI